MSAVLEAPIRHPLTVAALEVLEREGMVPPDTRVELLNGELFAMAPIGPLHNAVVAALNRRLVLALQEHAIVLCQCSVQLSEFSAPQPDFAVLKNREDFYRTRLAGPADILLLIEVADSSVRIDRETKRPLYARHGVAEFWLIDLNRKVLEVYRDPSEQGYRTKLDLRAGDAVQPLGFEIAALDVEALLDP